MCKILLQIMGHFPNRLFSSLLIWCSRWQNQNTLSISTRPVDGCCFNAVDVPSNGPWAAGYHQQSHQSERSSWSVEGHAGGGAVRGAWRVLRQCENLLVVSTLTEAAVACWSVCLVVVLTWKCCRWFFSELLACRQVGLFANLKVGTYCDRKHFYRKTKIPREN